jgi:hypothetical protein
MRFISIITITAFIYKMTGTKKSAVKAVANHVQSDSYSDKPIVKKTASKKPVQKKIIEDSEKQVTKKVSVKKPAPVEQTTKVASKKMQEKKVVSDYDYSSEISNYYSSEEHVKVVAKKPISNDYSSEEPVKVVAKKPISKKQVISDDYSSEEPVKVVAKKPISKKQVISDDYSSEEPVKVVAKKTSHCDSDDSDAFMNSSDSIVDERIKTTEGMKPLLLEKKMRGRPRKSESEEYSDTPKRKPGRPKKVESETSEEYDEMKQPKKRGRKTQVEKERMEAQNMRTEIEKIKAVKAQEDAHLIKVAKKIAKKEEEMKTIVQKQKQAAVAAAGVNSTDAMFHKVLNKTKNTFAMVTAQCNALKVMFDAIRDFSFGFYLVCDEAGIHFEDYDSRKKFAIIGNLFAKNFESYYCEVGKNGEPLKLGISVENIFAIMRPITNSKNTISMYTQTDAKSELNIIVTNRTKRQVSHNRIPLNDLSEKTKDLKDILQNYTCVFTYPSIFFQQTIKTLRVDEFEYVEFKVYDGRLELTCISDSVKRGLSTFISTDQDLDDEVADESPLKFENDLDSTNVYQGIFNLKQILSFTKCTPLCSYVKIKLGNDAPLCIEYDVSGLGTITLCLDPYVINVDDEESDV